MLSTREQKELRALQQRKLREREGRFLAEGIRVVEDLLASSLQVRWAVTASSLEDTERGRALQESFEERHIQVRRLSDAEFAAFAATDAPQGVLAVADTPDWQLRDIRPPADYPAVVLGLDAVQDPGNLGTLIRSAEALGAAGVIALPGTVDAWNPKAVRAAMGSSFRLPIVACLWREALDWFRGEGYQLLVAAAGADSIPAGLERVALIVGNEGAGVSETVWGAADRVVSIPLRGRAESLNVAAAAAILLYELTR